MSAWDVIVIGAGIAGASAAYELAAGRRVLVLERETQPGYHATGRSGAVFIDPYGNEVVQALTAASRDFFFIIHSRDFVMLHSSRRASYSLWAGLEQADIIEGMFHILHPTFSNVRLVSEATLRERVPPLRSGVVARALHDDRVQDLDVAAMLQGYIRGAKQRGVEVRTDVPVRALARGGAGWRVETATETVEAPVVVNAAGAWADTIAEMAGVARRGLTPMRRSLYSVAPPPGVDVRDWPLVGDVGETWYFKPESGHILASPSEEEAVEPCDARPDDLAIAEGVERLQHVLDLEVRRIESKWAGLRTFAPDRSPVVGFDPDAEGFFWLAGQGGFGIQTAPAMARLTAALVDGRDVPDDIQAHGLTRADVNPARLSA